MRYAIDTEFIQRGHKHAIDLISIAIVAEDGREYYAISTEFKARNASPWVRENVIAKLPDRNVSFYDSPRRKGEALLWRSRDRIRSEVLAFVGEDRPEFWGWCCDYDYVVLSQLVGFDFWPSSWPYYFRDLQQLADERGLSIPKQDDGEHDALSDARHIASQVAAMTVGVAA